MLKLAPDSAVVLTAVSRLGTLVMTYPDYLDHDPRMIFFTDFDGTITQEDCIDWLVRCNSVSLEHSLTLWSEGRNRRLWP